MLVGFDLTGGYAAVIYVLGGLLVLVAALEKFYGWSRWVRHKIRPTLPGQDGARIHERAGHGLPAPVFDEARAFASETSFAQRKEQFILPLETAIRRGTRRLSRSERDDCARSPWDLDRVTFYLAAEHAGAADLDELMPHIEQERERVVAHGTRSLIPLHYAVRAVSHLIEREPALAPTFRADVSRQFRELLDYLTDQPELDKGGQVKRNLRRTLDRLGDVQAASALARLVFNVTVPASTDSTGKAVCIAGDLDRLAGGRPQWNPGGVVLTRVDGTHWTVELFGKPGTELEYKFTLGDWRWEERGPNCDELTDNRKLTITPDAAGVHVEHVTVANWRSTPPCA